ncbi:hypothetical protein BDR22DRAFT_973322 [Usnea florida]
MLKPFLPAYTSLTFLLFLTLPHLLLARVPIRPLPSLLFQNAFNTYPGNDGGSCNRDAPNGVPMMSHVLKSLGGSWAISKTVSQDLPSYPTSPYIRGLMFLFFGITFRANRQISPSNGNVQAYNDIINNFDAVNKLITSPLANKYNTKPRFKCLEDYARYFTHLADDNGEMNSSAPLVGVYFDQAIPGGLKSVLISNPQPEMQNANKSALTVPGTNRVYPGFMWVYNRRDGTSAWYPPDEDDPPAGQCGSQGQSDITAAFTSANYDAALPGSMQALYGLTLCPIFFRKRPLLDLSLPGQAASSGATALARVNTYLGTSDLLVLHEFFHLISDGGIVDTLSVRPANPNSFASTPLNRVSWVADEGGIAYGYLRTSLLGLGRPQQARLNADNWAMFGGCLYFPELNCLGAFQDKIITKRDDEEMPFGIKLTPRAAKRIREGKFDLERDLPMDSDLEGGMEERETGELKRGWGREGESRFGDEDGGVDEILFG